MLQQHSKFKRKNYILFYLNKFPFWLFLLDLFAANFDEATVVSWTAKSELEQSKTINEIPIIKPKQNNIEPWKAWHKTKDKKTDEVRNLSKSWDQDGLRKWQWYKTTRSFREVGTFIYDRWETDCKTWIIHDIK